MLDWLSDPQAWASLLTLTVLEIVLGIDNIIFIAIMAGRLPAHQQAKARTLGLALALITRLALLASIAWIVSLTQPLFTLFGQDVSVRDLILGFGGLFLIYKGTNEVHHTMEGGEDGHEGGRKQARFGAVIFQIMLLDIIFSLDSVITAVGMSDHLPVMMLAVIIAVIIMLVASGPIGRFVQAHPTVKMLALAFLILVGVALVADGLQFHIPKGYLYFAIAFSMAVETLNLMAAKKRRRHGA